MVEARTPQGLRSEKIPLGRSNNCGGRDPIKDEINELIYERWSYVAKEHIDSHLGLSWSRNELLENMSITTPV